jgi:hypothetical protein
MPQSIGTELKTISGRMAGIQDRLKRIEELMIANPPAAAG